MLIVSQSSNFQHFFSSRFNSGQILPLITSHFLSLAEISQKIKEADCIQQSASFHIGRGEVIRTLGLCVPNAALYQTEPRLDLFYLTIVNYKGYSKKSQAVSLFYFAVPLPSLRLNLKAPQGYRKAPYFLRRILLPTRLPL